MLWKNIDPESVDGAYKLTYKEEKALYIWFIGRLLEDGEIKLARHGKFLSGSIDKQIEAFEMAFPKTEDDMDCDAFGVSLEIGNFCTLSVLFNQWWYVRV
ncbi:hypothetical protein BN1200_220001 [Klebsiella variicola]|nr:hypothetical protein BN1200_220001 [Klebsiella variicola]